MQKIDSLEQQQNITDDKVRRLYSAIEELMPPPEPNPAKKIGFV